MRRGPGRVGAVAVVGVLCGVLGGTVTACSAPAEAPAPVPTTSLAVGAVTAQEPVGGSAVPPAQWATARERAVLALAQRRASAAARGDARAWLIDLDGGAGLRAAQADVLRRMVAMRAGDVRVRSVLELGPPAAAAPGTPVTWSVRVTSSYRLDGFDTAPRTFDLDLRVKAAPADAEAVVVTGSRPTDRPQPWDLDGLAVRRSPEALVLAVGPRSRLDELERRARASAARVAAVWGRSRPAVWVAPATDTDAARLLGRRAQDLQDVAAATDGPLEPGEPAGADRVVLVPSVWDSLRPVGRDVVLTHELTHVTVRASTTRAVPVWLSEGFAELVAYRRVQVPERVVVATTLEALRGDRLPRALPSSAAFDPASGRLDVAYGESLLALRTLADRYGTDGVVRLYRAAAGGLEVPTALVGDGEAVTDLALRAELGTDRPSLVRGWQARIRTLLAQA